MADINKLVENYFTPRPKALTKQILYEMFDEVLEEAGAKVIVSGQQSERNLVNNVNRLIEQNDGILALRIGELGNYNIVGARQLGGGYPEPKADIVLITDSLEMKEIGLSMKKENFAFLENWMNKERLFKRLVQSGMEEVAAEGIIGAIISDLGDLTEEIKGKISDEKEAFLDAALGVDANYVFPQRISKDILDALLQSKGFSKDGKFRNQFKLKNFYANLSDILEGEKFPRMLELIIRGSDVNPKQADGVLIVDVPQELNLLQLQEVLSKVISIDTAVNEYANDPNVNIQFRFRPITLVRTTYSKTNKGKYKKGQQLYENPEYGISWTASVCVGGACES